MCDILKGPRNCVKKINQLFESSHRKKNVYARLPTGFVNLLIFSRFPGFPSWKRSSDQKNIVLISARYRLWMTKKIISAQATFSADHSRISHGGLESVASIELDFDCLTISNTGDIQ